MNQSRLIRSVGYLLVILFLLGCSLITINSGQNPPQQGDPQQGQPQPGEPQPGVPQPGEPQPGGTELPPDGIGIPPSGFLFDSYLTIPGGGGFVEATFVVSTERRILITLKATSPSMQPYGSLQYPDGRTTDTPPITTTSNGMNVIEIPVEQKGTYTLVVFDGSNQGGQISVSITTVE